MDPLDETALLRQKCQELDAENKRLKDGFTRLSKIVNSADPHDHTLELNGISSVVREFVETP